MKFAPPACAAKLAVVVLLLVVPACSKNEAPAPGKPASVTPGGVTPDANEPGGANSSSADSGSAYAESANADSATTAASADSGSANPEKPVVDPKLPDYEPTGDISGRLKSVGSDTMNNLMTFWSQDFEAMYRDVNVESEGKGSGTAIPAMIQGTADIGPMSRDITKQESAEFKAKFGYDPTQLKTAIDMVAVFVHKDNPIEGLTFEQLDAIFSVARKRGYASEIRTWGDLGLKGDWAKKPISLYGRDPASGTYVYFKEHVLEKGDYKPTVKLLPGSSAVVQGVASDQYGIGYSGIGYKNPNVRAVPLARGKTSALVAAEPQYAYDGTYPLSRFLLVSVNYKPNSALSPLNGEFLKFVFSKQGQADVIKAGFLPLPARVAGVSLESVGLIEK